MQFIKIFAAAAVIAVPLTMPVQAAHQNREGSCGEYMYWKDGKCIDARNAPAESWPDQMAKKKATW